MDQEKNYTPPAVDTFDPATRYTYSRDQQLELITRPDGQVLDLVYDSAGRLQKLTAPHGDTAYAYDSAGRIRSLSAPAGLTLTYRYDGALVTSETLAGPVTGTLTRSYDTDFRVQALSVNGASIAFGYDNDSLLTSAGSLSLTRNPDNGLLIGTALGTVNDSRGYNGFGEVEDYSANHNSTALLTIHYTRDALGRITEKTETQGALTTTFDYAYDLAGRLVEVKQNGVTTANYGYDQNGNRTEVNGVTVGQYDAQDRLLDYQGTSYTYTPNGELASKRTGAFTTVNDYDVLGNLRHVTLPSGTVIDYLIDGQNRRIGKNVDGALVQGFLYQNQLKLIAELDGNNQVVSRFVYADKPNVPAYLVKNGITYRIGSDHLGSPRLVVNTDTGEIVQQMNYDEWGRVTLDTNPGFQPFGFAGGLYDRDTKLVRFGARDYGPEIGRWTAKDPIRFEGGDTNLYGYVVDDPINLIDPNGEIWSWVIGGAIGAGYDFMLQYWQSDGNLKCIDSKQVGFSGASGAFGGGWLGRPYWRYVGPNSIPGSPWMTRGWGQKPPYGRDMAKAKDKLQLPNMPTDVQKSNGPWWQPVRGPRSADKHPEWGSGGGTEYARGWTWPE